MKVRIAAILLLISILSNPSTVYAQPYDAPTNSDFKCCMSYRAITSTVSKQYSLQQQCYTDDQGFRIYNNRYTIALGSGFSAQVGKYADVYLENGTVIPCVIGDVKQDIHTDSATHKQVPSNGNVVEFIVDLNKLDSKCKSLGDVSSLNNWSGNIDYIDVYTKDEAFSRAVTDSSFGCPIVNKYVIEGANDAIYAIVYLKDGFTYEVYVDAAYYDSVVIGESYYDEVDA